METIRNILQRYGTIKDEHEKQRTYFWLLDYGAGENNIKIELSKKRSPYDTYEIINFFGIDIWAMTMPSLFANKLLAMRRRWKNRDLFDAHYFFKSAWEINEQIILHES